MNTENFAPIQVIVDMPREEVIRKSMTDDLFIIDIPDKHDVHIKEDQTLLILTPRFRMVDQHMRRVTDTTLIYIFRTFMDAGIPLPTKANQPKNIVIGRHTYSRLNTPAEYAIHVARHRFSEPTYPEFFPCFIRHSPFFYGMDQILNTQEMKSILKESISAQQAFLQTFDKLDNTEE